MVGVDMSVARLEIDLLKVKRDLDGVKKVNQNFNSVLNELNTIKKISQSSEKEKERISEQFKEKEIIDIFASIEKDFSDLRMQLEKQDQYKKGIADFVESLRMKRTFNFNDSGKAILFLEEALDVLENDVITIKPQFIGTMDLGEVAINLGLHKTGQAIIVQRAMLGEVLAQLVAKRIFRNLIFETANAKIILKTVNEIKVESDNNNLRKLNRLVE
jgi:hypothetical protein